MIVLMLCIRIFFKILTQTSKIIEIEKLITRVNVLESKVSLGHHVALLHERKMDDMEQVSRKVNLRLKGIELSKNDSPTLLMEKIMKELNDAEVDIPTYEIDRCHRIGDRYHYNGKTYQDVLIKFGFWRSRNTMYQNRKTFSFRVLADLTTRRMGVLKSARDEVLRVPGLNDLVDFVFADVNCKLKMKTKSNRFYGFNTHDEFLSLVGRLRDNILNDDDSVRRKNDEESDELFY